MQTNVAAGFFMSMAFLPLLAKGQTNAPNGDTSSVINVSSISGAMKGSSMGQPAYAASKAAFTHVSRMLATLFKDTKVRVNVIAPGLFPSEMTAGKSDEHNKSQLPEGSTNPAQRKGEEYVTLLCCHRPFTDCGLVLIWLLPPCSWLRMEVLSTMSRLCTRMVGLLLSSLRTTRA
jgi:NAD(P)-dependent dehydrogenase (short-subunit alcohol dehydrogenase family)